MPVGFPGKYGEIAECCPSALSRVLDAAFPAGLSPPSVGPRASTAQRYGRRRACGREACSRISSLRRISVPPTFKVVGDIDAPGLRDEDQAASAGKKDLG
jgi:hypothetical protein